MCMRFSYKVIIILFFVFVGLNHVFSQITTTNAPPYDTEEYLVNDVLLGADLTTSNFLSQGFAQGIGYFDGTNANIGFEEGVILSTGGLDFVTGGFGGGSGISGEADLELALNQINLFWDVNNVTVLEFDFVAESESVTFNYVFGSSEYTSYTCSVFNDIFGFFLSGPGISGIYSDDAINLARIPDPEGFSDYQTWLDNNTGLFTNTPVAVNTVNSGVPSGFNSDADCEGIDPNWETYNIFWIDNDYAFEPYQGPNPPPAPEGTVQGLTGFTVPLQATYDGLICGETYHIKLAIADASDGALNSVVFLEANSFISPSVSIDAVPNFDISGAEGGVLEGCGTVSLEFIRSGDLEGELPITLSYSGTSTYGLDYENLPTEITLPANEEQFILPFDVFYDGIDDDQETLIITVTGLPDACGDVEVQIVELTLFDQSEIIVEAGDCAEINCPGDIIQLSPESISGGTGLYVYEWQDSSGNIISNEESIEVNTDSNTTFNLIVSDNCGDQIVGPVELCVNVLEYPPINIDSPQYTACNNDLITLEPNVSGGSGDFSYSWDDGSTDPTNEITFDLANGDVQQFSFTITDNCTLESSNSSVQVSLTQFPPINIDSPQYTACNNDLVTLEPNVSGGSGDFSYSWDDGSIDTTNEITFDLVNGDVQQFAFTITDNCTLESSNSSILVSISTTTPPQIFTNSESPICVGQEGLVSVENIIGNSNYTIVWNVQGSDYVENDQMIVFPQNFLNTYTGIIIDNCNLQETPFQVPLNILQYTGPSFVVNDVVGCEGELLEINVNNLFTDVPQSSFQDFNFSWSDGETSSETFIYVEDQSQEYSVTISDYCGFSNTETFFVSPSIPPIPNFYFQEIDNNLIQFDQFNDDIFESYQWDFGDNSPYSNDFEPTHDFPGPGEYFVTLSVEDQYGCINESTLIVYIYPSLYIYSPSVFTPNNDDHNNVFRVSVVGSEEFELIIYDRWGKEVFRTRDEYEGWDGNYKNGKPAEQAVYTYKVIVYNGNTSQKIKSGKVTLAR